MTQNPTRSTGAVPSTPSSPGNVFLYACMYTQTLILLYFLAIARVPDGLLTAQACIFLVPTQPRETKLLGGEEPAEAHPLTLLPPTSVREGLALTLPGPVAHPHPSAAKVMTTWKPDEAFLREGCDVMSCRLFFFKGSSHTPLCKKHLSNVVFWMFMLSHCWLQKKYVQ